MLLLYVTVPVAASRTRPGAALYTPPVVPVCVTVAKPSAEHGEPSYEIVADGPGLTATKTELVTVQPFEVLTATVYSVVVAGLTTVGFCAAEVNPAGEEDQL